MPQFGQDAYERVQPLSPGEIRRIRHHPKVYSSSVPCMVCGKRYQKINTWHLAKHGMSKAEYLGKYPGFPICVDRLRSLYQATFKETNKRIWSDPVTATACLQGLRQSTSYLGKRGGKRCWYETRCGQSYYLRSRLELAAAVQLDIYSIDFVYEPDWIVTETRRYLPDFILTELGSYLEIKSDIHLDQGISRVEAMGSALDLPVMFWTEQDLRDTLRILPKYEIFDVIKFKDLVKEIAL